jgi:hypothetical protein
MNAINSIRVLLIGTATGVIHLAAVGAQSQIYNFITIAGLAPGSTHGEPLVSASTEFMPPQHCTQMKAQQGTGLGRSMVRCGWWEC